MAGSCSHCSLGFVFSCRFILVLAYELDRVAVDDSLAVDCEHLTCKLDRFDEADAIGFDLAVGKNCLEILCNCRPGDLFPSALNVYV